MKFLRRLWRLIFRRKRHEMMFCSELRIAYRPRNNGDIIPILYRRKK